MKTNKREEEILDILRERQFAAVKELAAMLFTSASSIRRDLTRLEGAGLVKRNYGGVILCSDERTAPPLEARMELHKQAKKEIASKAASLLSDGMTVFLDGSTTVAHLVDHIAAHSDMTVFTNNIITAKELIDRGVNTYCIGGRSVRNSPVMAGNAAENMIRGMHADIFFFSSFALSDDGVISDCTEQENALRALMLEHADVRVFLCDSTKLHRTSTFRLTTLEEIEYYFLDRDD